MSDSIILQGLPPPRVFSGNIYRIVAAPERILIVCGRCGRLRDGIGQGWCEECHAEEERFVAILKVSDDSWEVFTGDLEDGFRIAAACPTFDAALAAGRLIRGRVPYPAFEARIAKAEGR